MFGGIAVFDKNDFVESVIARDLDFEEIIEDARDEIDLTESISYGIKGAPENRAVGSGEYVRFLGSVGFFLQGGGLPDSLSDDDYKILHRLAQHLVDRGDFSPDILELFGE